MITIRSFIHSLTGQKVFEGYSDWDIDIGENIVAPPLSFDDYVAAVTLKGSVVLVKEGKLLWKKRVAGSEDAISSLFLDEGNPSIFHRPVLFSSNKTKGLVVLASTGRIVLFNLKGDELWSFNAGAPSKSGVLVADINSDGRQEVVFVSSSGSVFCLSSKGKQLWKTDINSGVESDMAFNKETGILMVASDGRLISLNKKGRINWSANVGKSIAAPVITQLSRRSDELFILQASLDTSLYCLSAKGDVLWQYKTSGSLFRPPTVYDTNKDGNKEIFLGSCDNTLHALNFKGEYLWSFETDFWIVASPLIINLRASHDSEVVVGSYDKHLYLLDSLGDLVLDYMPGVSSIANQSGHFTEHLSSEPAHYTSRLLLAMQLKGMVTGMAKGDDSVILTTDNGHITKVRFDSRF